MPTTDAQKRAIKAYREKNREKVNEQARKDYAKLKEDPERLKKRNEQKKIRQRAINPVDSTHTLDSDAEFIEAFLAEIGY